MKDNQKFDNKTFWDNRYEENPELGSGLGSRGENLNYKRQILKQIIDAVEPQSILDIGCGDQFVTSDIPDDKYVGIDLSSVVISKNRKKYPKRTFIEANFLETYISAFDMTICFDVVIHIDNLSQYRNFVKRVVNTTKKCGVISGFEEYPGLHSEITFYHEPLSNTLCHAGAKNLRLLGKYRDTSVWYFTKDNSSYNENRYVITNNSYKNLNKPIFIVGTMRSGTTLLADLLGMHQDIVYCPFELKHIWSKVGGVSMASPKTRDKNCPNLDSHDAHVGQANRLTEAFYTEFERNLGNKSVSARFLNKNPHLCNKLSFVNALFPDARFIWIYRDLPRVVASLRKLFIYSYETHKTWHYWPDKKNDKTVRCWDCYYGDELPENVDKSRCFPGGDKKYLAEYWYETNKAVADFSKTIPASRFLAIREEELIANPQITLAKCYAFLEVLLQIPNRIDKIDSNRNEVWVNLFNKEEIQSLLDFILEYSKKLDFIFGESKDFTVYRKELLELLNS